MSNEPNAEAVKDAHDHLKAYIAETVGVPTAIYKAMHALTYAMLSRDEPQAADMMQRCTDMLADVPGATLEDKMTKYIGEYMALQLALQSQAESVQDESAWLIELAGNYGVPNYFQLEYDNDWTADADKALRFSRREDAQAYIHHIGWTEPKPVEHMWPALTRPDRGGDNG